MDRAKAPRVRDLKEIEIPSIDQLTLDCGIKVFYHLERNTEAFKIELVHKGGFLNSSSASESSLLSKMLLEGTTALPGSTFLESIDNLGSFIESSPAFDNATISLFGLKRYFESNINLLASVIYSSEMDQDRLEILKRKEINRVRLNQEKGSYLTSTQLRKNLFQEHPYGYISNISDISSINISQLQPLINTRIQSFDIFVSGDLPSNFSQVLNKYFTVLMNGLLSEVSFVEFPKITQNTRVSDDKFIQSSIRIGKRLFNRSHSDYATFMVLNEVLGGYFGSRLMKNIREEKGYTYGISSHLYSLKETGYFTIGTEVNYEVEDDTIEQIQFEINRLHTDHIGIEELLTVKNYMMGSFANSLTSPFAAIDKFKGLFYQGLDLSFYNNYISELKSISSESIRQAAQTYLVWEEMSSSIAGK